MGQQSVQWESPSFRLICESKSTFALLQTQCKVWQNSCSSFWMLLVIANGLQVLNIMLPTIYFKLGIELHTIYCSNLKIHLAISKSSTETAAHCVALSTLCILRLEEQTKGLLIANQINLTSFGNKSIKFATLRVILKKFGGYLNYEHKNNSTKYTIY